MEAPNKECLSSILIILFVLNEVKVKGQHSYDLFLALGQNWGDRGIEENENGLGTCLAIKSH